MSNLGLWWLLLIPVTLCVVNYFMFPWLKDRPTQRQTYRYIKVQQSFFDDRVKTSIGGLVISALILSGGWFIGKHLQTSDVEFWNGEIVSKTRVHDSYVRTYDCNCRKSCSRSGSNESCSETCDTCRENHYTVTWNALANIGSFVIEQYDSTSSGVYSSVDPSRYTIIKQGDPACIQKSYVNWIKGAKSSLFNPVAADIKTKYIAQIPTYPGVYDFYKANRIIGQVPTGVVADWNDKLSIALKRLGPQRQANVIVIFTKADPDFFLALQDAWKNGKKNDIILVIRADGAKADWVRVMSLAKNDIFNVQLRDAILELSELTADNVIKTITDVTAAAYVRRSMKEFKYLESEVAPPEGILESIIGLLLLSFLGFWFYIKLKR